MTNRKVLHLLSLTLLWSTVAMGRLEFDTEANKIELYGPYIKYNFLKEPYYLGLHSFTPTEMRMEARERGKGVQLEAVWPRFLLEEGELRIINPKRKILTRQQFTLDDLDSQDEKFARLKLSDSSSSLRELLKQGFSFCIRSEKPKTQVNICSSRIGYDGGQFDFVHSGNDPVKVFVNGKKYPKNLQEVFPKEKKDYSLELTFKSGFSLSIKDQVRHLKSENILIDPVEKRIGVADGKKDVQSTRLTFRDQLFSFMKEENYYINEYQGGRKWRDTIEEQQMEFIPYREGASMQVYGLVLPKPPPVTEFKLSEKSPIATYSKVVEISGTKLPEEKLRGKKSGELLIHENHMDFIWRFAAPKKAQLNRESLILETKDGDFTYSSRIFRAHQTSVSAGLALTTSPTLDVVPGYNFSMDHWFEELWNKSTYSFQRWGLKANIYETVQGFKPSDDYPENISILPANIDLYYRFTPGVRPIQSSFGVGVRYMHFNLFRSINDDVETGLVGVGAIWHTAPQKIVDDVFNVVPFFRYPKWMELSFFYYPIVLNGEAMGFSFSYQARGQMFFAKNWYLDASFNVNNISFSQEKLAGVTLGADGFGIATAHGTIGFGYLFN